MNMNSNTPSDPVELSRRDALKTLGAGVALLGLASLSSSLAAADASAGSATASPQPFTLPPLGYAYAALAPHIDEETMKIHHDKHHQAYITNANAALKDQAALQKFTGEQLLANLATVSESIRTAVRNNVGGHVNHSFFWKIIGPNGGGTPKGALAAAIDAGFGGFDKFKAQFKDAALKRFGSGWTWLVIQNGKLAIVSTANQDSPISDGAVPVIGLDVWEHAYYLHYQNLRGDYVDAFWNVVQWEAAGANFAGAKLPT